MMTQIEVRREQKLVNRRVSKYELELILQEVQRLLDRGLKIKEIAEKIRVPVSTAGRYIQKVTKRNQAKWEQIERESLESRAFKMKGIYEKLALKAEAMIDDPETSPKNLEIAAKICIGSHQNIYNMLRYGPLKLPKGETKSFEDKDID